MIRKTTKYGAVAAGLLALGFLVFKGCNKSNGGAVAGNDSIPTNPAPQPAPQPNEVKFDTIYAKKKDCYWNIAKDQLEAEGNASNANTNTRTRTIMADNGAKLAADSVHSDPMLHPGDPIVIRKSYN